jgi:hypothetical protein
MAWRLFIAQRLTPDLTRGERQRQFTLKEHHEKNAIEASG